MKLGKRQGFSLIEMIVVLVITAILSGAIYTTFSQGLRLWSRGSKDRSEWRIHLFLEKFTAELRNSFMDPKWSFQGNKNALMLATVAHEGASQDKPAYLRYRYDSKTKSLDFQQSSFEEAFSAKPGPGLFRPALEKVQGFELEYYAYDPSSKGYRWYPIWNRNCFPETVKVTIESEGGESQKMISMIDFPVGVACPS
ncbi:MAG: prepilin-type N-terminal cleavage/methylation domain-containing protein [Candidatus Omnitrophota bacterium]